MFWLHLSKVYCLVVSQQFVVIMLIFLRGEVKFVLTEDEKTFLGEHLLTGGLLRVVTCSAAT